MNPIAEIAESGSLPITKAPTPTTGTDARMLASVLVASVFAHIKDGSRFWHKAAVQLIEGTTDFRAAFMQGMDKELGALRKENAQSIAALNREGQPDPTKEDTRIAGKRVSTATVYASNLRNIAKAFNAGATVEALKEHACTIGRLTGRSAQAVGLNEIGWVVMVEFCQQFNKTSAGRKADPFTVKLAKWLEKNKPENDEQGEALYAQVLALMPAVAE